MDNIGHWQFNEEEFASILVYAVNQLCDNGDEQAALRLIKSFVEIFPDLWILTEKYAMMASKNFKLHEAVLIYEKWVNMHPSIAYGWNAYAQALEDAGEPVDKIITCYEHSVEIEPEYSNWHINLGNAYGDKGLVEKAVEQYEIAFILDPLNIIAKINMACVFIEHNSIQEANETINLIREFFEKHPNLKEDCFGDLVKLEEKIILINKKI